MNRGSISGPQLLLKSALVVLLLSLSLLLFKPLITGGANSEKRTRQEKKPLTLSVTETGIGPNRPSDSLAQLIDSAIDGSEFASARWGISVISLTNGRVVYGRNADRLFTPASNMKIFTTGVALDLLGADYRWRTSVYGGAQPDTTGTITGDLILYGRGAPDLVAQSKKDNNTSLAQLADDLYNRGLRRVRGNVLGDESYFRGEPLGDGWQWTDIQWYFGAEPSALSINGNEIDVNILPPEDSGATPQVRMNDSTDLVTVQNSLATVKRGERMTLGIHRGLSDNVVRVWGEFPLGSRGYGARLSVHNPALWAAKLFLKALQIRGIIVDGTAKAQDAQRPRIERFDPTGSVEQAFVSSRPLGEIVKATNKDSINLNAELILRTLGRERRTMVSASEPAGREPGDDEAGLTVIRLWLSRAGVSTEGLALHDGSGLSRLDLVTPESISKLLVSLSKTAVGPVFRDSLPISGRDGTLGGRLGKISGQVSAKTGALTYDSSLSGYLTAASGEILAFSIICNDETTHGHATQTIDQIVSILASYSGLKG